RDRFNVGLVSGVVLVVDPLGHDADRRCGQKGLLVRYTLERVLEVVDLGLKGLLVLPLQRANALRPAGNEARGDAALRLTPGVVAGELGVQVEAGLGVEAFETFEAVPNVLKEAGLAQLAVA